MLLFYRYYPKTLFNGMYYDIVIYSCFVQVTPGSSAHIVHGSTPLSQIGAVPSLPHVDSNRMQAIGNYHL